jgi:hypothetical protein
MTVSFDPRTGGLWQYAAHSERTKGAPEAQAQVWTSEQLGATLPDMGQYASAVFHYTIAWLRHDRTEIAGRDEAYLQLAGAFERLVSAQEASDFDNLDRQTFRVMQRADAFVRCRNNLVQATARAEQRAQVLRDEANRNSTSSTAELAAREAESYLDSLRLDLVIASDDMATELRAFAIRLRELLGR